MSSGIGKLSQVDSFYYGMMYMKKKNILGLCAKRYSCKRCPRYQKCTEELEKESKKEKK